MTTTVDLTPELECFISDCGAGGRDDDPGEVVRSGLRLRRDTERQHLEFETMLRKAEAEADRDGTVSIEAAMLDVDTIIASARG